MDMASVASATPISGRPKRRLSSRKTNASGYGVAVANGAYATIANIYDWDKAQDEEKQVAFCAFGWHCPIERSKNPNECEGSKGDVFGEFIKECWHKCSCSMGCGNRVIQRGITCKLRIFFTHEGKGWDASYTGATTCRGFCVRIRKGDTD
ncbi:hypothetical protein R1sor_018202 [Riccia sorocarpa]|uniref:Uncharacterized protein n=1 Tax=Riccia sorocarpa TaxID=122646 RepID=A0ABD3ICK7_9MARC